MFCDRKFPTRLKGKFYRVAIRPSLLYWTECWPLKKSLEQNMDVEEIRMLRWMCGLTRMDIIKNQKVRERLGFAPLSAKLNKNRLRWFEHVK